MSSGIEPTEIIDPWLFSTLKNDPTIAAAVGTRIHNGGALGAVQTPFITWDMNSSLDKTTHEGLVLWNECLFEVKVVGQGGSFSQITPIASRINTLLQGANVTTAKGVIACRRERIIRYVELDDNVQYRHLGAVWRITAHSL